LTNHEGSFMTVKLTLEFATLAELTAAIDKLGAETPKAAKPAKPATQSKDLAAPSPAPAPAQAESPAPSPATAPSEPKSEAPKARKYSDTKLPALINAAVDAGKGPQVKKTLQDLGAFDPADNTKVKGPFIKPEDFEKAEALFTALAAKEDMA
jgi:pyruvate/2-oxoglutarate dehydrogenase complex dihydrolipoamide acyltransferase (E2) component